MKKYVTVCVAAGLALAVFGVTPAAAQDAGSVGLVMMSGSSVGFSIPAGDNIAIRPSVAFLRSTAENGGPADEESTSTGWAPGVSVLFYVKSWDATRLYLSPQWTYSRVKNEIEGTSLDSKTTGHALSAMLGAQHNLGSRFAVFGETGVSRSTAKASIGSIAVGGKTTTWQTRSTIGAILFF